MADLFQIGLSGIYSSQASLATTGHNIANINTEGYSRQSVEIGTAGADQRGDYFVGRGSMIMGIERAYDQFAFTENVMNTSHSSYAEETFKQTNQLDQLLSNEYTSITKPVLNFFTSMNDVASNPNLLESRTGLIESASNMASQYNRLYANLEMQYSTINNDIVNSAKTITTIADNLASINKQISAISGSGGGDNTNDLLDQRDQLVTALSELVSVSVLPAENGMVNIYIGSGQGLVMGGEAMTIVSVNDPNDPSRKELALSNNGKLSHINGANLGGKVAALFDTRLNDVERAFNQLGQNVIGLTHAINEQQKEGQTLTGEIGSNIFNDINSLSAMQNRVLVKDDGLSNDVQLSVRIDDLSYLSADEFDVKVTDYTLGGNLEFTLTNTTTGQVQTIVHDTSSSQRIDLPNTGISIGLDNITNLVAGKSFTLRPTRIAAQQVSVELTDPKLVAVADLEIKIAADAGNIGNALIRMNALDRLDPSYIKKDEPITFEVSVDALGHATYEIFDMNHISLMAIPAALSADPLSGKDIVTFNGVKIEISVGKLADGDKFTLSFNETGNGDNRNMLDMSNLQNKKLMDGNKATFQDIYSNMLAERGAKASNADIAMQSTAILKNQSFERLQNTAGVNMDEEAANLLQFQQHYSAAARVITVANELFDTILQASR